ncbi:hypothetical protein DYB32_009489 [Aphanomyces invadans]|uniref:Uncharacterized protein n=1 Tax=Aphanomyces invadans TaxID=157072 RepID=A0A418AI89_9STRA|nr:hypothetical protein DYB32_009489 [Aphanomyces invadans]
MSIFVRHSPTFSSVADSVVTIVCSLVDGTLPRHTAVFDRSVLRDVDESAADNAGMAHDPVRRLETLRRDMHGAVSDIVRESSRGNAAAVKVALERRKELKEQIKQLQDLLTAQGRGSNVRRSSEGRVSLHDDLRASQVEVLARRSKTRESVGSFFSKESLDNLNPNDIAALQAKMDSLLVHLPHESMDFERMGGQQVSTPSSSDECRDNNSKGTTSPAHPTWRKSSDDGQVRNDVVKAVASSKSTEPVGCMTPATVPDDVRLSDIQIFTASNTRVDVKDLNHLDDIHSFAL